MTFLSPEADFANEYAAPGNTLSQFTGRQREKTDRGAVYPVHVKVRNPFDYENPEHVKRLVQNINPANRVFDDFSYGNKGERATQRDLMNQVGKGDWDVLEHPAIVASAKALGHDGMYMKEDRTKNLGVFDPKRIKSATGNRGTYDIREADMTKAEGGTVADPQDKKRLKFLQGSHVQERVYHGTGNLENMESFDPDQTGKGNDQLGSGFYFTNRPETANSYTSSPSDPKGANKLGGDTSPGVIAAHLAIKKPLRVGPESSHLDDTDVNLTHMQVKRIMNMAPNITHRDKSPLADHVDTSRGVTPAMIHTIAQHYTGPSLRMLGNDMFGDNPTAYREALHKVLGYDGVIKDFGNGEKHYVAWFPSQIKSAIGNRGTYDTRETSITKAKGGPVKPVVKASLTIIEMRNALADKKAKR
jgi:hypothetical protein